MSISVAMLKSSGLVKMLISDKTLTEESLEKISKNGKDSKSVAHALVSNGLISSHDLAEKVARHYGFPLIDLFQFDWEYAAPHVASYEKATHDLEATVLYRRGNNLYVGTVDPTDLNTLQQIKFRSRLQVEPIVVSLEALQHTKTQIKSSGEDNEIFSAGDFTSSEEEAGNTNQDIPIDEVPVVRFVQRTIEEAIEKRASDIHFEPFEKNYRVRFRIDGVLTSASQPPINVKQQIASRIKILSQLNISESRLPQDGRMSVHHGKSNEKIDLRVSTLPTLFGEKIVMRILRASAGIMKLDTLGYNAGQIATIRTALAKPYGMILVTGPTGSGKTVSLYSFLDELNDEKINISTAEDPAEINIPGINQVNINEKIGVTFAKTLRALLRQDPDIIMVGEVRDFETADIAIKASQTGHLVLSTLHTNDAVSTIMRLKNMGIEPYNTASSVQLIIAQRLVRKLCDCKMPHDRGAKALMEAGFIKADELDSVSTPFCAIGCKACHGTGYRGRLGIYEVVQISDNVRDLILKNAPASKMENQIRKEGAISMRQSGLEKILAGLTTIEEVLGATNID